MASASARASKLAGVLARTMAAEPTACLILDVERLMSCHPGANARLEWLRRDPPHLAAAEACCQRQLDLLCCSPSPEWVGRRHFVNIIMFDRLTVYLGIGMEHVYCTVTMRLSSSTACVHHRAAWARPWLSLQATGRLGAGSCLTTNGRSHTLRNPRGAGTSEVVLKGRMHRLEPRYSCQEADCLMTCASDLSV